MEDAAGAEEGQSTKVCPMCAEEIKAAARVCRYCGARFDVARRGYCSSCHAVVEADEQDRCRTCGQPAIDVHLDSRFVEEARPEGAGGGPGAAEPAAGAAAGVAASSAASSGAPVTGPASATPSTAAPARPASAPQAAEPAAAPARPAARPVAEPAAARAPDTAPGPEAAPAPDAAARVGEIVDWSAITSRMYWGYSLAALCVVAIIIGCWMLEWGRTSGGLFITIYRGPMLLPFVGLAAGLLGSAVIWNKRPSGERALTRREWAKKWGRNRRSKGLVGAYRPGLVRLILAGIACVLWAVEVYYALWGYQHVRDLVGPGQRYGGIVTLGFAVVGLLCALVGLPVRQRAIRVDSDATIYD